MNIKTKVILGLGLLFLLIILLSAVGARYLNRLKADTENILVANYQSVEFCTTMLKALDEGSEQAITVFEVSIRDQKQNITERGEREITEQIQRHFEMYKLNVRDSTLRSKLRQDIFKIIDMNMKAIQRKSEVAKATADKAVFWVAFTGLLCFLIAFLLFIKLPSSIANPIEELSKSIEQIAAKNYSERIYFDNRSEFGKLAKSFNTMAEKLEQFNNSSVAKLMMEKQRIEAIINNMHDPVIGLDENLKIIFANREAINITGNKKEELVGQLAQVLATKNDLIRALIQDIMIGEVDFEQKVQPIKIFFGNKESYFEKETLHISITPAGEESPRLVGHVIFLRNVTAYKELDAAKTNFIATVSHEFKTPISSMKMSLQLLQNNQIGTLNEEQKSLIVSISEDANRLLKITGELLTLTQVETGNIQLTILPSDPREIVQYAINANKVQADDKQIAFEIVFPETVPFIQADTDKTAWVLINLISNAIRYSYENSNILIFLTETDRSVHISVKDTGQGIAPQYKDKIFNRYFRIPGTKKEGTGLGLAICKEFIEAQGGKIQFESEYGVGSTFTISLLKARKTVTV